MSPKDLIKHFAEEKKTLVCLEASMGRLQAHLNFFGNFFL